MSTRFQAQTNEMTNRRLDEVRDALDLKNSDKAALLDEIAQIALWFVRQARQGRRIQAIGPDEEEPQYFEHVLLAPPLRTESITITSEQARALLELLEDPASHHSEGLQKTIEQLRTKAADVKLERWSDD